MPCLTRLFDPAIGPVINLGFAKPGSLKNAAPGKQPEVHLFAALIDTGADITCISPQIVKNVGLRVTGKRQMATGSGVGPANSYVVDLALPFGDPKTGADSTTQTAISESMPVIEFQPTSPHYQALLGRDIITEALFSMTGYDKRFIICM